MRKELQIRLLRQALAEGQAHFSRLNFLKRCAFSVHITRPRRVQVLCQCIAYPVTDHFEYWDVLSGKLAPEYNAGNKGSESMAVRIETSTAGISSLVTNLYYNLKTRGK